MAATDVYGSTPSDATLDGPAGNAATVSTSDSTDLGVMTRAVWVGGTGDLKVTMKGGQTVVFSSLTVGWHPLRVARIWATGTTATNIVAVW